MPKRTTTTYSSEDAPDTDARIYVYYCRYSGDHAFITDVDLETLPRRTTDGARVIDTQVHNVKLKVTPGAVKYINRGEDKVEKQFRYNCGELPVLYKSEQHGRYIYVMDGAVTAYAADGNPVVATELGEEVIVPPCITQQADGRVQIGMDIEDGGKQIGLIHITADEVGLEVMASASKQQDFLDEVREYMGKVLKLRLAEMTMQNGWSQRTRLLFCKGITPQQVFQRLQVALQEAKKKFVDNAARDAKRQEQKDALSSMPVVGLHVQ
mmetsp:Transcript_30229/g.58087  ORF Transcript_30229/g.58087 Transcript_30229/m.58087 type:complete len:267 (+) Transcript_30229:383-1183(+)|eukprot:CAMPEP_0114252860 /NCGR_PEP_ID=MMETSP0058-20121206/16074_1 /TAXON_ID=36894 /ORGANISM="Pyramimonas parkeae, CCMP726" /LENGTH=266 /DNA_ID=CAMNT_0001366847 /DNA_START=282 /DNA_END=1082 /DNA_ORIENTATION=+